MLCAQVHPCNTRLPGSRHQGAWTGYPAKAEELCPGSSLSSSRPEQVQFPLEGLSRRSTQPFMLTGTTRYPSGRSPCSQRRCSLGSAASDGYSQADRALGAPASNTQAKQMILCTWSCSIPASVPVGQYILSKDHCARPASQQHASRARSYHDRHFV